MKITHIIGSPRSKSRSTKIASEFCRTAEENGAEVSTHVLSKMDYIWCRGCMVCKQGAKMCVIKDDLKSVLQEIDDTDVLVVSTPIYSMDVPGHVKMFMDRLSSYLMHSEDGLTSKLSAGKKALFVQAQGTDESQHRDVYEKYQRIFGLLGFSDVHVLRRAGLSTPVMEVDPDILNEAGKLALRLV